MKKILTLIILMLCFSVCLMFASCFGGETEETKASENNSDSTGNNGNVEVPLSQGLEYTLSADEKSYSVTNIGECRDAVINIPNEYNGLPVTSIGKKAFCEATFFTSVIIPNSVTSIHERAFSRCDGLEKIEIPNSVKYIGERAFSSCEKLTCVVIPENVTSIYSGAFCSCNSLKKLP